MDSNISNDGNKTQRAGSISRQQKQLLIEIMEASEDLRKGKFHPQFTYKDSQQQWKAVMEKLNAIPGAKKDWIHWRRTWQDLKKSVKKKNSDVKKHAKGTGGGPPMEIVFTEEDESLLHLLDKTALEGDAHVSESEVIFLEDEHNYAELQTIGDDTRTTLNKSPIIQSHENRDDREPIEAEQNNKNDKPKKTLKRKRNMATQRLERSQNASENLCNVAVQKVEIKRKYFEEKIEILKQTLNVCDRIATALESIAGSLITPD